MIDKRVEDFAKENGYKTVRYLCEWRGFSCYEPIMEKGEISYIGLPLMILVDKGGKIRMSTPEEAMEQINEQRDY